MANPLTTPGSDESSNFFAGNMFFHSADRCTICFVPCGDPESPCVVPNLPLLLDGIALRLYDAKTGKVASPVFLHYLEGEFRQLQSYGPGIVKVSKIGVTASKASRAAWEKLFAGTQRRGSSFVLAEGPELFLSMEESNSVKYICFQVTSLTETKEYFKKLGIPVSEANGILTLEDADCPGVIFQFTE